MFLTTNTKAMYLASNFYIKSVTNVKTTPVAETIVKFYEIAHFSLKTTPFYKKLPLFIENYPPFIENFGPPPYRKLKPLISAFIENSIFGNNRDPCGHQTFSSLRQMISTSGARVDFPTPPPTPSLQSRWTGDWWMVPRGIMTRCSSCSVWGPLTP